MVKGLNSLSSTDNKNGKVMSKYDIDKKYRLTQQAKKKEKQQKELLEDLPTGIILDPDY